MASFTSGGVSTRTGSEEGTLIDVLGAAVEGVEVEVGAVSALWLLMMASTMAGTGAGALAGLAAPVGAAAAVTGFLLLDRKPKIPFLAGAAAAALEDDALAAV